MKKLILIFVLLFASVACGGNKAAAASDEYSYDLVSIDEEYTPKADTIEDLEKEFFKLYSEKNYNDAYICATILLKNDNSNIKYNFMYYDSMMHMIENEKDRNNMNLTLYYENIDMILRNIYNVGKRNIEYVYHEGDDYVKNLYNMASDYIDSISIYK